MLQKQKWWSEDTVHRVALHGGGGAAAAAAGVRIRGMHLDGGSDDGHAPW